MLVTVNELELEAGILDTVEDPNLRCFWFQRQIEELEDNLSNEKAREYVDLVPDEHVFDVCMTRALHNLKDERVIKRVGSANRQSVLVDIIIKMLIFIVIQLYVTYTLVPAAFAMKYS